MCCVSLCEHETEIRRSQYVTEVGGQTLTGTLLRTEEWAAPADGQHCCDRGDAWEKGVL